MIFHINIIKENKKLKLISDYWENIKETISFMISKKSSFQMIAISKLISNLSSSISFSKLESFSNEEVK